MATIGSLVVNLAARTGQFTKGLAAGGKSTSKFVANLERGTSKLLGFGGALTSIAGAAGLGFLVKKSFASIDALAKTADKIGISTENLSRLQHAAELTGVPITALNMGLQRFGRRVSQAADGAGEAQGALRELGLDAQRLEQVGLHESFLSVADALEKIPNPLDRVRIAQKLFDSEGVALVNTLAAGREGLEEMGRESDRLGRTISAELAKKVQDANDAMLRLWARMGGIVNRITGALAPALEWASDRGSRWIGIVLKAGVALSSLILVLKGYVALLRATAKAQAIVSALSGPAGWAKLAVGIGLAGTALWAVDAAFDSLAPKFSETTAEAQRLEDTIDRVADAGQRAGASLEGLTASQLKTKAFNDEMDKLAETFIGRFVPAEKAARAGLWQLDTLWATGRIGVETYDTALRHYSDALDKATGGGAALVKDLEKQIATFGMSARQAKIWEAAQGGANEALVEQARALDAQLTALEKAQEKTQQLARAQTDVADKPRDVGFDGPRLAGAAVRGSQEAFSAIARHRLGVGGDKDVGKNTKRTAEAAEKTVEELEEHNRRQRELMAQVVDILS